MNNYVVVYDSDLNFCRLFKSDSNEYAGYSVLWTGNNLRAGYDEMIRQNKNRKKITVYYVCSKLNKKNIEVYKLQKNEPTTDYTVVLISNDLKHARREMTNLIEQRNNEIKKRKMYLEGIIQKTGIKSKRVPKFTETDKKYIRWLEDNKKIKKLEDM